MSINQTICDFATLTVEAGGWMEMDYLYLQNCLLGMVGGDALESIEVRPVKEGSIDLLDQPTAKAREDGTFPELPAEQEIFEAQLMDFLTPPPSVVSVFFAQHYSKSPEETTEYFFNLSKKNDYIKTRAVAGNIRFPAESEYGKLEITISLSKPEKDPKQIVAEREAVRVGYPTCMLCMESGGCRGRLNHPACTSHRIIRMNLDSES